MTIQLKYYYPKLVLFVSLPLVLIGCAPQLAYQEPAPVYRPRQEPIAQRQPPAPEPKPKPKLETFKISNDPIIGENLADTESAQAPSPSAQASPDTAAENAAAPTVIEASEVSAADAGYSAPQMAASGSPAVLALMQDAERNSSSGDLEAAAVAIERAQRIDSRNPSLYYKLAQVRLEQNQPRLAEDLAKKSALLAENNRELKKNSWLLIAKAKYMQGDKQGAEEARAKAERF